MGAVIFCRPGPAAAQTKPDEPPGENPAAEPSSLDEFALAQEQIRGKYQRFEQVLLRMSELTAASDPKRAALLRKAVGQSKEKLIGLQLERVVEVLKQDRLANAVSQQSDLEQDLAGLLELLLTEQRSQKLKDEREKIKEQIRQLTELINKQQQLQGQTAGGADAERLAESQEKLKGQAHKLAEDMQEAENDRKPQGGNGDSHGKPKSKGDDKPGEEKNAKPKDEDDRSKSDDATDPKGEGKQADKEKAAGEEKGPADKSGEGKDSDESDPSKGKDQGQQNKGQEKPSGQGQEGQDPGQDEQQDQPGQEQQPSSQESARQRVQAAQKRMEAAKKKLEKAERDGAIPEQEQAVRELELAKAKLEDILRQLREEEMQRTLAMLEARFRKMLEMQIEVHDATKLLAGKPSGDRDRNDEIEAGRLGRKESQIVIEVDSALALLHEEGSSVAFPEAVGQMREDMEQVVSRLSQAKADEITVGIEEEIIAALEEMIAALQKAQKDQEEKQQQQQQGQPGEPQDPPLVDALAELRMIRSLQMRVNHRTARYSKLVEGEEGQADKAELIDALQKLSERETRIFKVTRDIVLEKNK